MAKARSADFKTVECRLSFAQNLFKARSPEEGKPKQFGCTLIFPKSARASLEAEVAKVIKEEWGEKEGLAKAKAGLIKSPFLAGDGKEARNKQTGELHPGMGPDVFFIRPKANEDRPPFVIWRSPNTHETETSVYSGCYGKAVVNIFAWHNAQSGDGISFGIQGFQKLRDGERLGGGGPADPERWAETIEDDGPAPESTRTGQGAAGLFGS
jgi:ssDNA-binding protein